MPGLGLASGQLKPACLSLPILPRESLKNCDSSGNCNVDTVFNCKGGTSITSICICKKIIITVKLIENSPWKVNIGTDLMVSYIDVIPDRDLQTPQVQSWDGLKDPRGGQPRTCKWTNLKPGNL